MKINQLKSGVLLSYGTQIVQILSGILYTPVMLRLLGQNEYGLYQLVASVVSYLGLLSFGFSSGYVRFYSKYKVNNDSDGIAKLNGMFIIIFGIITFVCLVAGGIMVANSELVFGDGLSLNEHSKAKILLSLMVINMAITLFGSIFNCYVTAHQKFFFQRLLQFLNALLHPFIVLPLLLLGFGSVGMVMVSTVTGIIILGLNLFFCIKKIEFKVNFSNLNFGLLKEIWGFTFFIFINMIVDQINWNVDKFLLGRMVGTTAVAIYGVAATLNTMYMSFSTTISGVFAPKVNMLVVKNVDDFEITQLFTKIGRIQFVILALVISGYILFGKEFIGFWAGSGYKDSYIIGIYLMIPAIVPLIQNVGIEIQRAKNKHHIRAIVYLLVAISNIFISIVFIKYFGTTGAAMGTALSLILGNIIFMNIYYHKKLGLNMIWFWKEISTLMIPVMISMIGGCFLKNIISVGDSILLLGVNIVIYILIYSFLMLIMGLNSYEKDLIIKPISKIVNKLKKW